MPLPYFQLRVREKMNLHFLVIHKAEVEPVGTEADPTFAPRRVQRPQQWADSGEAMPA
jgi:hypothetical protein